MNSGNLFGRNNQRKSLKDDVATVVSVLVLRNEIGSKIVRLLTSLCAVCSERVLR